MNEDKRYCVYVHKDSDGNVRYVGSGTESRAISTYANSGRSRKYSDYVDKNGRLLPEIIFKSLTLEDARKIERSLYEKYVGSTLLLNVRKPTTQIELDTEYLRTIVEYNTDSPSFLIWKVDIFKGRKSSQIQVTKGTPAGWIDKSGYYKVSINSKNIQAHRIVACIFGLDVNNKLVDHVNGIKTDNSIENLRVVDFKQNSRNRKTPVNSTTGISGLSYRVQGSYARYCFQWIDNNGVKKSKTFKVNGKNKEQVLSDVLVFRKQILSNLGDYSDNHGVRDGI